MNTSRGPRSKINAISIPRGIRGALNPVFGDSVLYVILFPATALFPWYWGVGPSVVSVLLAVVGMKYWFIPPLSGVATPYRAEKGMDYEGLW